MTKLVVTHEVEDRKQWEQAWHTGPGGRGEMMAAVGVAGFHLLQDPQNPNLTGVLFDISDLPKFMAFMQSAEAASSMANDGIKPGTVRTVLEFAL